MSIISHIVIFCQVVCSAVCICIGVAHYQLLRIDCSAHAQDGKHCQQLRKMIHTFLDHYLVAIFCRSMTEQETICQSVNSIYLTANVAYNWRYSN